MVFRTEMIDEALSKHPGRIVLFSEDNIDGQAITEMKLNTYVISIAQFLRRYN